MRFIFSLLAPVLLSGCLTATASGSGFMSTGSPVVGKWEHVSSQQITNVQIISPEGWSCNGVYESGVIAGNKVVTSVPIKCTDGRRGDILLTLGRKIVGAFKLSDGKTGQIIFE